MGEIVVLPKLGVTMEEGLVTQWFKEEGEAIDVGEMLLEVETDKVTLEVEAETGGIVRKILLEEMEKVPIGTPIAIIADEDEDISALLESLENQAAQPGAAPAGGANAGASDGSGTATVMGGTSAGTPGAAQPATGAPTGVIATPRAKALARQAGIDIALVNGTGENGRIGEDDVRRFVDGAATGGTRIPYDGTRKVIGEKLQHSLSTKPHFYDMLTVDLTAVERARAARKAAGKVVPSAADYLMTACQHALAENPLVNSTFQGDVITQHTEMNVGYAVATDRGLMVPVLKGLQDMDVEAVKEKRGALVKKALEGTLSMDDMSGGTFTVSNLGPMGVKTLTAIINEPEVSILAVGAIEKRVVVDENDQMVVAPCMDLTLCSDHRVLDGLIAAGMLGAIKTYLEGDIQ